MYCTVGYGSLAVEAFIVTSKPLPDVILNVVVPGVDDITPPLNRPVYNAPPSSQRKRTLLLKPAPF